MAYISLGLITANVVFVKHYVDQKGIQPHTVLPIIFDQAKLLLAPLFFTVAITFLMLMPIIFISGVLDAILPIVEAFRLETSPIILTVYIMILAIFSTFPIFFAIQKKSFLQSLKSSATFAGNHLFFTGSVASILLLQHLAIFYLRLMALSQFQLITIVVNAVIEVYVAIYSYHYWSLHS